MQKKFQTVRILGIEFFNDQLERAIGICHTEGGLILAPSGPGLAELGNNPLYDEALYNADLNLIDSGYLALLWKRRTGITLQRHSGLKFIQALIDSIDFRESQASQLWVMPSLAEVDSARDYLHQRGLILPQSSFYTAPHYSLPAVKDEALLERIRERRPRFVVVAIAGGKQEILGYWLRQSLDYRPAIVCIGAAIAFLSGHQANIPAWADRAYLGWFFRVVQNPKTFFPRYWKAKKLRRILHHYEEQNRVIERE